MIKAKTKRIKHFNHLFAFSLFWGIMQYFWPIHCIYLNCFSNPVCYDCVIQYLYVVSKYVTSIGIWLYLTIIDAFREMQICISINLTARCSDRTLLLEAGVRARFTVDQTPRCNSPARFTRTTWSSLKRSYPSYILIPYLTREKSIRHGLIIGASERARTIWCGD